MLRRLEADAGAFLNKTVSEAVSEQAERARRDLSKQSSATMVVTWRDKQLTHDIDLERFEQLSEPLLTRMREPRSSGSQGA